MWTFLAIVGCTSPPLPVAPPQVTVNVQIPWRTDHHTDRRVVLRLEDGAEGVRIDLDHPGVSPIRGGHTLTPGGHPMVVPAWPVRRIEIETQRMDAVVRMYGPPLNTVTDHPEAPDEPVHTWVRLRPRTVNWRIVLTGLGTLSLPVATQVDPTPTGFAVHTDRGVFTIDTHSVHDTALGDRWTLSTVPSLGVQQPYPKVAMTWD